MQNNTLFLKCVPEKKFQFGFYIFFYIKYKTPETGLWGDCIDRNYKVHIR